MSNVQLPLPTDLRHQPIFGFPYFLHDPCGPGNTDAQYISLGYSQWNPREISLKIMRHIDKWSRQSEELPPPRAVDAVSVLALCMLNGRASEMIVPAGFFENQPADMIVKRTPMDGSSERMFLDLLLNDEILQRRLDHLTDILIQLRAARA